MNAEGLFKKLGVSANTLPLQLDAKSAEDLVIQFRELFSCPEANEAASVVYLWATGEPIPRLKGKSNVVYIGKTKQSLRQRHRQYAEVEGTEGNWNRYKHIIETYGPIVVLFAKCRDPRDSEQKLLGIYSQEHLEIPPLNRVR